MTTPDTDAFEPLGFVESAPGEIVLTKSAPQPIGPRLTFGPIRLEDKARIEAMALIERRTVTQQILEMLMAECARRERMHAPRPRKVKAE